MGVINHNAVLAINSLDHQIAAVKDWIADLPLPQRDQFVVVPAPINAYVTVILCPDGSKEGWPPSDAGNTLREEFIQHLETYAYDDGSNSWDWVEIGWGEYGQAVLQGNCENRYDDEPYAEPSHIKGLRVTADV